MAALSQAASSSTNPTPATSKQLLYCEKFEGEGNYSVTVRE